MVTKMGPRYAYLFDGYVEEKMLRTYSGIKSVILERYTDDNIVARTTTKKELEDSIQYVNEIHPSMKYIDDISDTSFNVLDISMSIVKHGQTTDIIAKKLILIHISDMILLIHDLPTK